MTLKTERLMTEQLMRLNNWILNDLRPNNYMTEWLIKIFLKGLSSQIEGRMKVVSFEMSLLAQ